MSIERDETLRIQKTSVRGESEVWILNGYFYKKMTDNELDAYVHLERHSITLEDEANISVPQFLGPATVEELRLLKQTYEGIGRLVSEDQYKISTLRSIDYKDIEERFGLGLNYTSEDFDNIFESLRNMRRIVSNVELEFPEDYESSAPDLIQRSKKTIDGYLGISDGYPLPIIEKTQSFLKGIDKPIAHRDLNWSNIGVVKSPDGSKWNLEIADWGSFGFAYSGYDEGRLFTRLSLNLELQEVYLNRLNLYVGESFNEITAKKFLISFWRTAVIRSHREIALTLLGRYANPVNFKYDVFTKSENKKCDFYHSFIESHKSIIKQGVDNLEILLSN